MKSTALNKPKAPSYASSCNACRQCTPLGACLAFKGIEGAVPFLHGSQGCATYIRRYLISHFREPIDIASSSFSEDSAIFGGERNFRRGIGNLTQQYHPKIIGVATTCLSETIGDDVPSFLRQIDKDVSETENQPKLIHVSTPSYTGSHIDGFHEATRAVVKTFATRSPVNNRLALFPGMISTEDIRSLKQDIKAFELHGILAPDYSDTMDGPAWESYHRMSPGGTPLSEMTLFGGVKAAIDFTHVVADKQLAGAYLQDTFGVTRHRLPAPIGISATDDWLDLLSSLSGIKIPLSYEEQRGRLIDAIVDGHKYLSKVPVALFGEADHVLGLCSFISSLGLDIQLVATGGKTKGFEEAVHQNMQGDSSPEILNGSDFRDIESAVDRLYPRLLVGNSKGYTLARRKNLPLLRTGFPIHDRFGGQRLLHFGYAGAQRLLDELINTIITHRQSESDVGWTYI
ncbi:nitrogenase component 1 [Kiritimatiellota bacterium B12222]|nr:nitrogenase component 1 [Kiritimatiellota bacterium B12222]